MWLNPITAIRHKDHAGGESSPEGQAEKADDGHASIPDINQKSLDEIDELFGIGLEIPVLW